MKKQLMKMKKPIAILVALVIIFALAACTNNAPAGSATAGNSSAGTSAGTSAGGASTAPVDLTWQTWTYEHPSMDPAIAAAQATDFPGVNVTMDLVPITDHYQKLKVALASGGGPDVFDIQSGASAAEFAEFCEPIGPLAEKAIGADWQSKFDEFAMQQASVNGTPVGLPVGLSGAGILWCNKTLLDKYSVQPPKTLDDLKALSATFRKNGELPFCIGAKDGWNNEDAFQSIVADFNAQKYYDALAGKAKFTDPDIVSALNVWQKLFTEKTVQDGALGMSMYNDCTDLFLQNKVPVLNVGLWWINNYTGNDTFMKNVADGNSYLPIRFPDVNGDGKAPGLSMTINSIIVVNKNSKHKEEAMKVAESLAMGKIYQNMIDILWFSPSVKGTKPQGQYGGELQANLDLMMGWMGDIAGSRQIAYPDLQKAIDDQLQALAAEQTTPQKAAEAIESVSATLAR